MRTVIYSKIFSSDVNSYRITSKLKLPNIEFFYFQNNIITPFSTSKILSRHASPKTHSVISNLSNSLYKTLSEQKEEQKTKKKGYLSLFEEALGLKVKWSTTLLSDLLLRFKSSTEIKKKSLELGLSPNKFKKVMQKFVSEVWDNKLARCKTEALQSAYNANGVSFQFYQKKLFILVI
jgi:hypothetical protein